MRLVLDSYKYELFKISHPIEMYPTRIDFNTVQYLANNREELMGDLKTVLSSDETRRIIQSLLAQSLM
jgi:hypothetical protein